MSEYIVLKNIDGENLIPITKKEAVKGLDESLEQKQDALVSGVNIRTINGESILGDGNITIGSGGTFTQVQADWEQSDSTAVDYVKNKPNIPNDIATLSDLNNKQDKIDANHKLSYSLLSDTPNQVQSNWNETDQNSPAFIANKPNIPSGVIVDQVYDPTSANAQSGIAVASAIANSSSSGTSPSNAQIVTSGTRSFNSTSGLVIDYNNSNPKEGDRCTFSAQEIGVTNYLNGTDGTNISNFGGSVKISISQIVLPEEIIPIRVTVLDNSYFTYKTYIIKRSPFNYIGIYDDNNVMLTYSLPYTLTDIYQITVTNDNSVDNPNAMSLLPYCNFSLLFPASTVEYHNGSWQTVLSPISYWDGTVATNDSYFTAKCTYDHVTQLANGNQKYFDQELEPSNDVKEGDIWHKPELRQQIYGSYQYNNGNPSYDFNNIDSRYRIVIGKRNNYPDPNSLSATINKTDGTTETITELSELPKTYLAGTVFSISMSTTSNSYLEVRKIVPESYNLYHNGTWVIENEIFNKTKIPTFAGLEISPGPLYYDGTTFKISNYWDDSSYGKLSGKVAGSTYFSFLDLGSYFDSHGIFFDANTGDIDNTNTVDGYRVPTLAELQAIFGNNRNGSTVNGFANKRYAKVRVNDLVSLSSEFNSGAILFPDDFVINGVALAFGNYDTNEITANELNEYINQGCVFMSNFGYDNYYFDGNNERVSNWNPYGNFLSADSNDEYYCKCWSFSLWRADTTSKSYCYRTRLVRPATENTNFLNSKENISNKVIALNGDCSHCQYPSAKAVYNEIYPKVEPITWNTQLKPNIMYVCQSEFNNVYITWTFDTPVPDIVNHYYWVFDTGYGTPTIVWPVEITKWTGGSPPVINPNTHYEISVIDGVASYIQI